MPTILNITITPTAKKNRHRITLNDERTGQTTTFESPPELTEGEASHLWRNAQYQKAIGEKLYRFLDGDTHHLTRALEKAKQKDEHLQLHLTTSPQTHDWPFELLAKDGTYVLTQKLHLVRKVTQWGKQKTVQPKKRPLRLLFMASSAIDVKPELEFEQEEEAILKITADLPIQMEVEDSGTLEGLKTKLELEEYDVIHMSGHAGIDEKGEPYILMEDEIGRAHPVYPKDLYNKALIENPPRLIFLSAGHTGEAPEKSGEIGNTAEGSFARHLVEKHDVPAVLGWGRKVKGTEAAHAGKLIYKKLSEGKTILEAVRHARNELITAYPAVEKPAWPMLRLFSSGIPLKSIVTENQPKQPKIQELRYKNLNGSQVKVLDKGFVGRRRQIQAGIRVLKYEYDKSGIILLGTGGLGKSCLAGKLCERLSDYTLIILHGKLNSTTLTKALTQAFKKNRDKKGLQIVSQKINMSDKLPNLCATTFKENNTILLLDDFEQNLEGAEKGEPGPVLPEAAELMTALLHYLPQNSEMTKMIITSRYEFSITENNRDLAAETLQKVKLTSFREAQQLKKLRGLKNIQNYKNQTQVPQLLAAGHGNPRLMERLDKLVGEMKSAEVPQLLEAIKDKQEEFIQEHVIRELIQRGGSTLENLLKWLSIYRRPVLTEGVEKVSEKAGIASWENILERAIALSLAEHDQQHQKYQVTPLQRDELLKGHADPQAGHCAAFDYYKETCTPRETIDPIQTEEWIYHALECGREEEATHQAARLVTHLGEEMAYSEARRVGEWMLAEKKKKNRKKTAREETTLLNALGQTIYNLADYPKAVEYYQQALAIDKEEFGQRHPNVARDLNHLGEVLRVLAEPGEAIKNCQQALEIWTAVHGETHRDVAAAINNLGEAMFTKGDYSNAADHFEKAANIWKTVYDKPHSYEAKALSNLGEALRAKGEPRKAIPYYQQAIEIDKAAYGENHTDVARHYNNQGLAWYNLGEYDKAIVNFEKALDIWREVYGENNPRVAAAWNNLGDLLRAIGEPAKALGNYEKALPIFMGVYGEKH
ncbi:MAG: tetratricopeptide repeat protein, partial [bacterium]|nr:tetratricopeptide repeat protein [bacterium]